MLSSFHICAIDVAWGFSPSPAMPRCTNQTFYKHVAHAVTFMNQSYDLKEQNQVSTTRPFRHKTALTGIFYITVLYVFMNQILDQTVIINPQPVIISLTSLLDVSGP